MSANTYRGIDFTQVARIEGERGELRHVVVMDDGTRHTVESYPGEDMHGKLFAYLRAAR